MLPRDRPGRIHVAFDDHRLVTNAGRLLPATLAQRLGLGELLDRHVDLGCALRRSSRRARDSRTEGGRCRSSGASWPLSSSATVRGSVPQGPELHGLVSWTDRTLCEPPFGLCGVATGCGDDGLTSRKVIIVN